MGEKQVTQVVGNVEIVKVPYEVLVPEFVKKEIPEYVLVKEEITYKVPKILFEEKTYEKPKLVEKEYILPKYIEKEYIIPIYVEKVYEIPKIKFVEKIVTVEQLTIVERKELKVVEKPYEVRVPNLIKDNIHVTNAIIHNEEVINAIIKHVTIEALHPTYICGICRKEKVDPVGGSK